MKTRKGNEMPGNVLIAIALLIGCGLVIWLVWSGGWKGITNLATTMLSSIKIG